MRKTLSSWMAVALLTAPSLISLADPPSQPAGEAGHSDSRRVLMSVVMNPATPPEVIRQILHKFCEKPEFTRIYPTALDLQRYVAGHPLVPEDLQQSLARHIDPHVRTNLAGNGALTIPLRRQLAADPFACVANAARDALSKAPDADTAAFLASLPALDTLNPANSFSSAVRSTIAADDPNAFHPYQDAFDSTPDYPAPDWSYDMIELGAVRCLRDQIDSGKLTVKNLAAAAFTRGWTPQMTDLVLGKSPGPDIIETFSLAIVERGRAEDFESLEKRNVDLAFVRGTPLVWHAVTLRDGPLLKRLIALHADPTIPNNGLTPAQEAVRIRCVAALDTLPLDAGSRADLETFRKRFPGDPKAEWLGFWIHRTERKPIDVTTGDFIGLDFAPDGTAQIRRWNSDGTLLAWARPDPSQPTIELTAFDPDGKEQPMVIKLRVEESKLILAFNGVEGTFVRPDP